MKVLTLGGMSSPDFFFKIVVVIWGPLQFHMDFRVSFSISAESIVGIMIWVALNPQGALGESSCI